MRQGLWRTILTAGIAVLLPACGWLQPGYNEGHTYSNDLETTITPGNVSTLVEHTIPTGPVGNLLIVGDLLLVTDSNGLTAFDRRACPRSDNGPCTPKWQWSDPGVWHVISDGRQLFLDTLSGVVALDLAGRVLWKWAEPIVVPPAPGTSLSGFGLHGGRLFQTLSLRRSDGKYDSLLEVFPTVGCGGASCAPRQMVLDAGGTYSIGPTVFVDDTFFIVTNDLLRAIDIGSGTEAWRAPLWFPNGVIARDGKLFVNVDAYGKRVLVFDTKDPSGCGGTPRICAPLQILSGDFGLFAASSAHLLAMRYGPGASLTWRRSSDTSCPGPLSCPAEATSTDVGAASPISPIAVGGRVVYVLGDKSIHAFDEAAVAGCGGTPKVCSPLWTANLGDVQSIGPRVFDGRVYTVTPNTGLIHVFTLAGAIS